MAFDWGTLIYAGAQAGSSAWEGWRNRKFQREVNEKNEALMREGWARDDTAVQRQAADMEAAGLSKTLAAGGGASSGSPIQLDALESNAGEVVKSGISALMNKASIAQTNAGTKKLNAEAESAKADARVKNVEADRIEASAGIIRDEEGNIHAKLVDHVKQAMGMEAQARNIEATTEYQRQEFINRNREEFQLLELRSQREKWNQEKLRTETMKLTKQLLEKEKNWYTAKQTSGIIGNITGAARNVQGYLPFIAQ